MDCTRSVDVRKLFWVETYLRKTHRKHINDEYGKLEKTAAGPVHSEISDLFSLGCSGF